MKIVAKQINPCYQESPLFMSQFEQDYPNITITGNRGFEGHKTELYSDVVEQLDNGDLTNAVERFKIEPYWHNNYKNLTAVFNDLLPRADGKPYNSRQIHDLKALVSEYYNSTASRGMTIICLVMGIVSGVEYDWCQIHGYCQSDWQDVFFPVKQYSKDDLDRLEIEYFNLGSEWVIDEDGNNLTCYCYTDDVAEEIAEYMGCSVDEVELVRED